MQDHIPDALITAFERQYDSSWNDPKLRNERLAMRYGWAAAMEAKPCLHQIQEPAPATTMDALREAEAALEVAMARILKADPSHSICVTSEAKALVAVRAALAATPAAAPVVQPETVPTPCRSMFATQREYADAMAQHRKNWAEIEAERGMLATGGQAQAFQQRVQPWMMACFGPEISADVAERNHRFLEEALELVQACGCTASEAHQLVDYVFGRPVGDKQQEVGGVMVTLAALCLAQGLDMHAAGEVELARIWTKVEAIRAKQAAKPKHSPLPEHAPQAQADARDAEQERWMGIGKAIERACVDLPAGAEINIHLEKDAGTVTLSDCDGDEQENFPTDEGLAGVVNAAIDAAIAAAKGE